MDLFEQEEEKREDLPLAVRMRPEKLAEFVGQEHLLGKDKILHRNIEADRLTSLIIWGPPGTGKTSLGQVISNGTGAKFVYLNGSFCSSNDIKKEIFNASIRAKAGQRTVLFIDEIHRLNRLQQDVLIPDTETSRIILIGATTYNPFFYINPALISRSLVCEFKPLSEDNLCELLKRALADKKKGLGGHKVQMEQEAVKFLAQNSSGDARRALGSLELGVLTTAKDKKGVIAFSLDVAKQTLQLKPAFYDRKGDYHYDVISAFIKSVRGSDADASLYWLARMLYSGEDPRFVARRLVILASEDIGLADPFALVLASSCFRAVEFVGMPEAKIILSEATIYLCQAPKSNSSYQAIAQAWEDIEKASIEEVPLHLKNPLQGQAKKTSRGKDYKYPHNFGGYVEQKYRREKKKYYFPKDIGREGKMLKNKEEFKKKLTPKP
ncbi:MAG: replication-associated recombination protein A [Candidatus Omnitrophica bacterium]|nr:replication-associated recombination protein A [Candidatus Omnitrophota bacterium]